MITGALILLLGTALGWFLRSLPARRKGPKPIEALCGCEHHHAMHDAGTGHCHSQVDEPLTYNACGSPTSFRKVQCPCRRYSGPEPIPSLYAPEIAGEAGQ